MLFIEIKMYKIYYFVQLLAATLTNKITRRILCLYKSYLSNIIKETALKFSKQYQ